MGRIETALERLRQRRAGSEGATGSPTGSATAETAAARQSAIQAMPTFPEIPYDVETCTAARVLLAADRENGVDAAGAAAYRMLRTRILQRTRSNHWNTIGITSPGQGDGKSITAINLALAIAREGNNNVFLIDLDMRSPKLCAYLGVAPPRDINDYFAGDAGAEDVLFSIGIDNLSLAGTLTRTDHASELLATGRVEELFEYVRGVAPEPLILVDLPPLLSTDDAIIVAPKVDACLLVLSEGRSTRDGAAKALDLLAEFKLAGIVLNRSHAVVADYYSS
jgi:protein-tyrosine kinase